MAATKDFFISYTAADQGWAEWIAWTLEQDGYTCVLQSVDFVPGQDFIQEMRAALNISNQVIAVLSDRYFNSKYAGQEMNAALARDPLGEKRTLVPVRIQDCNIRDLMNSRIHIDLVGLEGEQAKTRLLQGVAAAQLGRRGEVDAPRFPAPPKFPGKVEDNSMQAPPAAERASDFVNILFLASETRSGLDLRGQAKGIKAVLGKAKYGKRFKFSSELEVTTDNIFEIVNHHRPQILHFSGKQNGGDVLIATSTGDVTTVKDRALAGLLQTVDSVQLAIIDTCKSARGARTVSSVVDFAMGVEADIWDHDAIAFYEKFYAAIAAGASLEAASGRATAALSFKKVRKPEIPRLFCRNGADPKNASFVKKSRRT